MSPRATTHTSSPGTAAMPSPCPHPRRNGIGKNKNFFITYEQWDYIRKAACAAQLSEADFMRVQIFGQQRQAPPPRLVELPARSDIRAARAVSELGPAVADLLRHLGAGDCHVRSGLVLSDDDRATIRAKFRTVMQRVDRFIVVAPLVKPVAQPVTIRSASASRQQE